MKQLKFELGGRPLSNDDLGIDQDEVYKILNGIFNGTNPTGRGAFIISGCDVTGNAIASGLCFIDGEVREFSGATVVFPYYIFADTESDEVVKQYKDGSNLPTQHWSNATGSSTQPGTGEFITMSASGGRSWIGAQDDQIVTIPGSQTITGAKTFTNNTVMTGNLTLAGQNVNTRLNSLESNKANKTTNIGAGTGLTGGGDLSSSRTISVATAGITTTLINDGAITTSKLAENSVTTGKIAAGAVGNSDLANNAVTSAKIADGTITGADIASKTITAADIADNTLTASQLAANSVGSSELADNAVDTGAIQTGAVTNAKLGSNSVTSSKIATNAVGNSEMIDDPSFSSINGNTLYTAIPWTNFVYSNQSVWGSYSGSQRAQYSMDILGNVMWRGLLRKLTGDIVTNDKPFMSYPESIINTYASRFMSSNSGTSTDSVYFWWNLYPNQSSNNQITLWPSTGSTNNNSVWLDGITYRIE